MQKSIKVKTDDMNEHCHVLKGCWCTLVPLNEHLVVVEDKFVWFLRFWGKRDKRNNGAFQNQTEREKLNDVLTSRELEFGLGVSKLSVRSDSNFEFLC